jgi:hypothetical protein
MEIESARCATLWAGFAPTLRDAKFLTFDVTFCGEFPECQIRTGVLYQYRWAWVLRFGNLCCLLGHWRIAAALLTPSSRFDPYTSASKKKKPEAEPGQTMKTDMDSSIETKDLPNGLLWSKN